MPIDGFDPRFNDQEFTLKNRVFCPLIRAKFTQDPRPFSLNHHFYIEQKAGPRQYTYQRGVIATRYSRTQAAKLARGRHAR